MDPSAPTRYVVQPQQLPYGLSAEGLGLRPPQGANMQVDFQGDAIPAYAPSTRPRGLDDELRGAPRGGKARTRFVAALRPASPAPSRRLRGKILLHTATRFVVSIAIDGELDWKRPKFLTLLLSDGTKLVLELDARTTAAGVLMSGQILRLSAELSNPFHADPERITVGQLQIELFR